MFNISKKQLIKNVSSSMTYTVVSAVTLFLLYKHLFHVLGPEKIGLWSVVVSTTAVGKLSELGLSTALTRFVAVEHAKGKKSEAARIVETGIITVVAIMGLALLGLEPLLKWAIAFVIEKKLANEAVHLLHYTMVSMLIGTLASLVMSGLDGCQRVDLRSYLNIFSALIYFVLAVAMTKSIGLVGLAWAQIAQAAVVATIGWFILKKELIALPSVPYRWDRKIFEEIWSFGYKVQLNSLLSMLIEPAAKMLIAKFGGLSDAGYFELANRLMTQVRSLIASASQVLTPMAAAKKPEAAEDWQNVYTSAINMAVAFTVPITFGLVAMAPTISIMWIGRYEATFVQYLSLLSITLMGSVAAIPAYFVHLGSGGVKQIITQSLVTGLIVMAFGALLGLFFNGVGVVVAYSLAIFVGSLTLVFGRHDLGGTLKLLRKENVTLWIAGIILSSAGTFSLSVASLDDGELFNIAAIASAVFMMVLIFKNATYRSFLAQMQKGRG